MKPFTTIAVVLLTLIGLVHLLRLFLHWSVVVNGMVVPVWASAVAAVVSLALATLVWRENRR